VPSLGTASHDAALRKPLASSSTTPPLDLSNQLTHSIPDLDLWRMFMPMVVINRQPKSNKHTAVQPCVYLLNERYGRKEYFADVTLATFSKRTKHFCCVAYCNECTSEYAWLRKWSQFALSERTTELVVATVPPTNGSMYLCVGLSRSSAIGRMTAQS
jgi:hypothetical protein